MNRKTNQHHVFTRNLHMDYALIVRGEGIYLYDADGNRYMDACSGSLVSNIGHGNERVVRRMAEQSQTLAFTHGSRFLSTAAMALTERLAEMAPGDLNRVYLVSGGSESTETAIKLARQYFQERDGEQSPKWKVVGREASYHGATIGALGVTGHQPRRKRFAKMLPDFPLAAACYCYRCPFQATFPGCGLACANDVERVILEQGPETIAAVMAEPVVGAASGALVPPDGYLQTLRAICDKYDILLIADEVMTGCGRTGAVFAVEHWGVVPDILCVAKGLSAGYAPLGAVVVREPIFAVFEQGSGKFTHGFTYAGNPTSAAVGDEVLRIVREENLTANAREQGTYLLERLRQKLSKYPIVGDVRGLGLMIGVELVQDFGTRQPFPVAAQVAEQFTRHAMSYGVVVYPGNGMTANSQGDQFLVGPPLNITRTEVDELVDLLDRSFATFTPAQGR